MRDLLKYTTLVKAVDSQLQLKYTVLGKGADRRRELKRRFGSLIFVKLNVSVSEIECPTSLID